MACHTYSIPHGQQFQVRLESIKSQDISPLTPEPLFDLGHRYKLPLVVPMMHLSPNSQLVSILLEISTYVLMFWSWFFPVNTSLNFGPIWTTQICTFLGNYLQMLQQVTVQIFWQEPVSQSRQEYPTKAGEINHNYIGRITRRSGEISIWISKWIIFLFWGTSFWRGKELLHGSLV